VPRWGFILSLTLAAAAATPAHAQNTARAPHVVPDFSGIWAHFTWPDFEPPIKGPGPVTNTSRRNGIPDAYQLVGDHRAPILQPRAAEIVKQHGETSLRGIVYPTPSNQCWPGGVPFVLVNIGMRMLQEKDKVTILYTNNHEVRHVRLNAAHPSNVMPSWYGDSVGHYEGDTLVIDTVGIKAGPYAMVDMYGTPHSETLHVVERYRLLGYEAAKAAEERGQKGLSQLGRDPGLAANPDYRGKGLQLDFIVEDSEVFTTPWSAGISYRRPSGEWPEMACADNPRDLVGRTLDLPQASEPDF
jgi:hypothetical protein